MGLVGASAPRSAIALTTNVEVAGQYSLTIYPAYTKGIVAPLVKFENSDNGSRRSRGERGLDDWM